MKIRRNPSATDVRRFCAAWAMAAVLMGGVLTWRRHPAAARVLWSASALAAAAAFIGPLGRRFHRLWMALADGIQAVVTGALLVLIFWGVLTPMALIFKLLGRDALRLKKPRGSGGTYWNEHDRISDVESYKHLY